MQNTKVKTQIVDDDAERQVIAALTRLQAEGKRVVIDLPAVATLDLIAQLQLALRHPSNTGASAHNTRAIVDCLLDHLEDLDPALRLLRRGDDPRFDVRKETKKCSTD